MTIYLMQAEVDLVMMARWSGIDRQPDPDHAVHALMYNSFGIRGVPKPFATMPVRSQDQISTKVMAYSKLDAEALRELALARQTPEMAAILSPATIRTARLPERWQKGATLSYTVRVRPTFRQAYDPVRDPVRYRPEIDVFFRRGNTLSRDETYVKWLEDILRKKGAEPVEGSTRVVRYALRKVRRNKQQRLLIGPDATLTGLCEVKDSELWSEALEKGIGRHKSYGYGMILLAPPQ